MNSIRSMVKLLCAALTIQLASAFVFPRHQPQALSPAILRAVSSDEDANGIATVKPLVKKIGQFATTAAVVVSTSPLMAFAEEADDYEYGAVNAPIGIAWAGGVLAILTALLPVALQGGEEAFEEMRERDEGKFGTGDSSALDRRKRR